MQAALILMTILGCDDTATMCHHIETRDERWATIQACDAVSEDKLGLYSNTSYPVVVAVCQTPQDAGIADVAGEPAAPAVDAAEAATAVPQDLLPKADIPAQLPETTLNDTESDTGLASRVLQRFKDVLPEAGSLKALVAEPVHVVTDSYSWVAKRFDK